MKKCSVVLRRQDVLIKQNDESVWCLQAKRGYEKEERKREAAIQRGEGTWMLPCVSERIDQEQQVRIILSLKSLQFELQFLMA